MNKYSEGKLAAVLADVAANPCPLTVPLVRTEPREALLRLLRELATVEDLEMAHSSADAALLIYIGDEEISAAYHAVGKWDA